MEAAVRDIIRKQVNIQARTGDNVFSASLYRYISRGELYAYNKEIDTDKSRFLKKYTITGTGDETYSMPSDLMRIYKVVPNETDTREYTQIDYNDRPYWANYPTPYGIAYYLFGNTIGLLPAPSATATAVLIYYYKYQAVSADASVNSDLHEVSQYLVVLYAAVQALKEMGDVNWQVIQQELERWEAEMLPTIRRDTTLSRRMNVVEYDNYGTYPFAYIRST